MTFLFRFKHCVSRSIAFLILALLVSLPKENVVQATAGDLDVTFSSDGRIGTDFGGHSDRAEAVAIQSDGKIVVGGRTLGDGHPAEFGICRYNPDGSLDSGFGTNGKVITQLGSSFIYGLAIQPDGKIVAGGGANFSYALARYNSDGSLDLNFGVGGKVTTSFNGFTAEPRACVLQQDGKIILAGSGSGASLEQDSFVICRYNNDGSLDSTFGSGGVVITSFSTNPAVLLGATIQMDGKLIAVGATSDPQSGTNADFAVVRYNLDGSLDMSFGAAGKVVTDFNHDIDVASAVSIQADGKIIVAGEAYISEYHFALARYNTNGTLDTSFGTGGKASIAISRFEDRARDVLVQADGRIIVAGVAHFSLTGYDFAVVRLTNDGRLDPSFGTGGIKTTDFLLEGGESSLYDSAQAMALQPDGRIVVAGETYGEVDEDYNFAVARYLNESPFDLCLQDDSNGNRIQINTTTGEYWFTTCSGITLGGTGTVTKRGNTITLQHNAADRRVTAKIDSASKKGTASVQTFSPSRMYTITDKNTTDNTCTCSTN